MADTAARICKGCWQQLRIPVPLGGPLSLPFRAVGIRRSRMNPNTCTICETMFERIMKRRSISTQATVLFADLRGYSALSQRLAPGQIALLLDAFYGLCGEAIWRHDGLLNKLMGDAVMAVFNFPIRHEDHAAKAVAAARDIQRACRERVADLRRDMAAEIDLGVGIGIDSGLTNFGEFGHAQREVTAIGTVVNLASRAQGVAPAGAIMVTAPVRDAMGAAAAPGPGQAFALKGFDAPVALWDLAAA